MELYQSGQDWREVLEDESIHKRSGHWFCMTLTDAVKFDAVMHVNAGRVRSTIRSVD